MPSFPMVRFVSTSTVKPPPLPRSICHLSLWDLSMLSAQYIQKGLLFANLPPSLSVNQIVEHLKASLSTALLHFYPLAGRLATQEHRDADGNVTSLSVSVDCNGEGAEFIHAAADNVTVADVLSPSADVPSFVQQFFAMDLAVNHDGHVKPLVVVQVTELVDGVFVGCSMNHVLADGTSYWHFFQSWAEISRTKFTSELTLSRPPVLDRWFIEGYGSPPIKLPFQDPSQFIYRYTPSLLRERMFHLSQESLAKLKAKANQEIQDIENITISSFQAMSSLMWRSITRARRLPPEQNTTCRLAIENRPRLRPPLSPNYFGASNYAISATVTAAELLAHGLGWSARLINKAVAEHTDEEIRNKVKTWMENPMVYKLTMFDSCGVMFGSSPRFDVYGCEFGWGKAVAARSGIAHKFDGKVSLYPGWEGGGSMDLEVCLSPENMRRLEEDEEFITAVSPPPVELEVLLRK
ncbi:protein ENHANCED PSEUDOMONAS SUSCEPTIBILITY 1-like [Typha angustifolia]|uniref:protein ENHANCED PSEUDOMONAS SUSCEPTIBILITY 1-like n=1 Tax=Typha angustifolia TaxID=59011 RepID=UPI003C2EE24C